MVSTLVRRVAPTVKPKLPWMVPIAVLWMVTVDALTGVGFGPVSLSGALTLGTAMLCIFFSPMIFVSKHGPNKKLDQAPIPLTLTLFVYYVIVRAIADPSMAGTQNVAVLVAFVLTIGLTAIAVTEENIARVGRTLRRSAVTASCIAIVGLLAGLHIYGNRTFALAAIVFLAILVPHGSKNPILRIAPVLPFVAIALSLSRVALAIGAVLLIFVAARKHRGPRLFFSVIFLGGGAALLLNAIIENYQPLRDRFMETGDGGLIVGGVAFNTSGRGNLWDLVFKSAMESPVFGKGPGSATELVTNAFGTIAHPHNDYLRLLHDYGFVGLGFFCFGYLVLLAKTFRRALRSDEPMHWSAALALAGVAVAAITDNVVIYPYAMIPLGVVVGASLALPLGPKRGKVVRPTRRTHREMELPRAIERQKRINSRNAQKRAG